MCKTGKCQSLFCACESLVPMSHGDAAEFLLVAHTILFSEVLVLPELWL